MPQGGLEKTTTWKQFFILYLVLVTWKNRPSPYSMLKLIILILFLITEDEDILKHWILLMLSSVTKPSLLPPTTMKRELVYWSWEGWVGRFVLLSIIKTLYVQGSNFDIFYRLFKTDMNCRLSVSFTLIDHKKLLFKDVKGTVDVPDIMSV